ncbi:Asparagine synthetase [Caenispirillum salinarum AK4]|uniref:asparagine synthase (glutamine-hydrolyzing) n=1 Tax=Caenispirillum salinarum AK4 TaxID=1238182 RepID=K9GIV5_9PROT|nr:asparagine synthase (glutamine-hydrolyzing) [Caenispirillum salinarum]EKV25910.1 Asparagine synthetase [Caenispirillum salinarum AK4]
MCGILGAVGAAADRLDDAGLVSALDLIRHRGPDAGAVWRDRAVALGHRRLAIIDLDARAEQPMTRGDLTIVFNGEIYNYRALKQDLEALGHGFTTTSDTEVLLAAWRQWGRDCLTRLEGMFAFALWDAAARALTLARDRFGEKPLFWLRRDDGLMFCSEVPPLVRLAEGRVTEDAEAIGLYFLFSYIPAPAGAFTDLRQLEPGHWLEWRADRADIEGGRYYDPRDAVQSALADAPTDYGQAVAGLRDRLTEAVRLRLETADVPVATLLSGGIDSSVVTTLAARISDKPLTAYSLGFPKDPEFDESDHARAVAAGLPHVRHRVVPADEESILDFADTVFDRLGEPFADSSLLPTSFLCAHIEEKVALGGDAADELFAGYGTYPAIVRGATLPAPARALLTALPRHGNPHAIAHPRLRAAALFHKHLRRDAVDSYLSWRSYADPGVLAGLGLDTGGLPAARRRLGEAGSGALRDVQLVDLIFNLPNDMLRKVDYAAMYHSIEVRLPFLDSALAAWALALPDDFRMHGGVRKRILRDAFAEDLPRDILTRRKMGFLLPVRRWFRQGRLRDELEGLLARQTGLDGSVARAALDRHAAGAEDNSVLLWALYAYLRWQGSLGRWAGHAAAEAEAEATPVRRAGEGVA